MPTSGEEPPSLLDPETLQGLLRHLESTDVDELEVVHGAARVYLRREPGHRTTYVQGERPGGSIPESAFAITAPLTGIYYGRPSPDQPAFISEGEAVEPGQVVALIETMKLFNEVTAELFGTVVRIAVAEHDPVELGQTLMYVQPANPKDLE